MYIWRSTDPVAVARMLLRVAASRQPTSAGPKPNVIDLAQARRLAVESNRTGDR